MKSFEWVQAATVAEAVAALDSPGAVPIAGGVDLLDRMKEWLATPNRLVSLRKVAGLADLVVDSSRARIGANVTLARLASDPGLRKSHPVLAEAAGHAATPQLREMATLGGNLAQRPRCWYFRQESFVCKKKGGSVCYAMDGDNEHHAIFQNTQCAATFPSTLATVLVALGAKIGVAGKSTREVALADLIVPPEKEHAREIDLAPGEIITHVDVPAIPANVRTAYTKQVAKQSFDWPIVDVAVALELAGRTCKRATIVLGAVAPTPLRPTVAEQALVGAVVDEASAKRAARSAIADATPLSGNAHKVRILEVVVARTILAAVGGQP